MTVSGSAGILPTPLPSPPPLGRHPLDCTGLVLAVLLAISGFFAMTETPTMASNRYRLRANADRNYRGAKLALGWLDQTAKLLGVILLFNTLINAAIATPPDTSR